MAKRAQERQQDVLDVIEKLEVLPTTADIPLQILRLQRRESASVSHFAEVLKTDPSLCTKVLGFANSAWFAPTRPITKVSDAISMIGLRQLLPLILASAIGGIYEEVGLPKGLKKQFWESSVLKAVGARECAEHFAPKQVEEAYICGLIQDVALPIMYAVDPDSWPQVNEMLDAEKDKRREREEAFFGLDHAGLGGRLVERLGLPEFYQEATKGHHDPAALVDRLKDQGIARSLEFAALLPHDDGKRRRGAQKLVSFFRREDSTENLRIPAADVLENIEKQYNMVIEVMGQEGGPNAKLKECLSEAGRELTRQVESMIGESKVLISTFKTLESDLKEKIQKLEWRAGQSDYDGLTGILNRRGFLSRSNQLFAKARELGLGCAIGFIDVDNFKAINDHYGHRFGDFVLRAVSETLRDTIAGSGIVGRFGGDEFTFLVVAEERAKAMAVLEGLADRLCDLTVTADDVKVCVAASIGLLWLGTPHEGQSLESAIEQADKCMYEAKRSRAGKYVLQDSQASNQPEEDEQG
jgi:diguanylate cyclase (GGDEF)-like protein